MSGDYVPYGLEPEFKPIPSFAEREPSFGEYIKAEGGNALRASPVSSIYRATELASANADPLWFGEPGEAPTRLSAADVTARAEKEGVKLDNLGKGQYTEAATEIMIDRAVRRQFRDTVIGAYKPSGATALSTGLIASLADPLNIAAAFIPVVGEVRYAELLAGATGLLGRTGVRAVVGGAEGAVGAAVVEPLRVFAETQEGQDYALADSLRNLAFGTVFGAGLHTGFGAIGDKVLKRRYTTTPPESVPEIIDKLPQEAQQAALSAGISDAIAGKPIDVAPVVDAFIQSGVAKDVSFTSTLRRDGPPLDDLVARTGYWEQELASLKSPPKKPVPFLAWLKQQGGLRDIDNDIRDYVGDTTHLGKGYISQKGATRTERGLTFDDLFERAKAEGYITTRQELRDAFKIDNEVTRATERDAVKAHQDKAAYIQKLLEESGVNPKTKNQIKARAIAGRERHIYAAEQARLATATDRLNARGDDYRNVSEPQPVKPYEYEKAGGEDTGIQAGDTVFTLDEKGLPNEGAPRKVASIVDDPTHGRYVFFEGNDTKSGYPANQLQVHQRAPRKPEQVTESPKTEKPKPDETTGKYSFEQFAAELKDAFDTTRGRPVSFRAMEERLPGISRSLVEAYARKMMSSDDVAGVSISDALKDKVISKKAHLTLDERAAASTEYQAKVDQARRNLDAQYTNLAKQKTYYLSAIAAQAEQLSMGLPSLKRYLNKEIEEGRLKAFSEDETQLKALPELSFNRDYMLDQPDIALVFDKETPFKPGVTRKPSAFPPDQAPAPAAEVRAEVPAQMPRVETPPAERNALTATELQKSTEEYQKLQEATLRKYEAIAKDLPPETAALLRQSLDKINSDADELSRILESATQCMVKATV